jgi:nucleoside-diphosphate-sugar epimerase
MERGRKGQKYLFATEFMTLAEIFAAANEITGLDRQLVELPVNAVRAIATVYSGTLARFFPKASQRLTPGSIAVLQLRRRVDASKAQRELGFSPTSLRQGIHEAIDFFQREGMITRAPLVASPGVRSPAAAE